MKIVSEIIEPVFQPIKISITISTINELETLKILARNLSVNDLKEMILNNNPSATHALSSPVIHSLMTGLNSDLNK